MKIERKIEFRRSRPRREESPTVARSVSSHVARVSRLMALAIRLAQLIHDSVVTDQAELARVGHITRARLTQIMNLLCLAPDIQEKVLFLPAVEQGRAPLTEKLLRPIAATTCWRKQRRMWTSLLAAPRIS